MLIAIFVNRAYHKYTRGYNFPIRTFPKKNSVSEQWVIFRGSSLFFALSGHSHVRGILKSNNAANAKNGNGNDIEEENADVSGGGEDHSGDAKS